jgi:hypothetical protein
MTEQAYVKRWRVDIYEMERGWGSRLEDKREFASREEADAFVREYNAKNTAKVVPDYYWYAEQPREVFVPQPAA